MSADESANSSRPPDDIDLLQLIGELWSGRWWILATFVIGAVAAAVLAVRSQPLYRAQLVAAVASQDDARASPLRGELGGLAALAGISLGSSGDMEETRAVMRSREFSERFIPLLVLIFAEAFGVSAGVVTDFPFCEHKAIETT